jgi:subtilase family serine protease
VLTCKLKGSVSVTNLGSVTSPDTVVSFYLSTDGTPGGDDSAIGQGSVRALKVGKSKAVKLKMTLPVGVSASGKYVIAVVDPADDIAETNEDNNTTVFGPIVP